MNIDLLKTSTAINKKLQGESSLKELHLTYSLTTKLRSQLIGVIYEKEYETANYDEKLSSLCTNGEVADDTVTLTIYEPLPPMKEFTAAMQDYWFELIQTAIKKSAQEQKLPYFEKAFVFIEITTPKYSDNSKLWDTSNRAINLIINNLKGTFFKDDNFENMSFGVDGNWGENGRTVIKIMPFERLSELFKK